MKPPRYLLGGAQRVLRKNFRAAKQAHGNLIVTRVETFVDAR
jgi:hypothetical protein